MVLFTAHYNLLMSFIKDMKFFFYVSFLLNIIVSYITFSKS